MKRAPITVTWTCPECKRTTEVAVQPVIRSRLFGAAENCHPEEGGEIEPNDCVCGAPIKNDGCHDLAREKAEDGDTGED